MPQHKIHMIRNPRGETGYFQKWNSKDTFSWTDEFRAQVPYGIDPLKGDDGIFFVDHEHLKICFDMLAIAHYRDEQGYKTTWFDVEKDDETKKQFSFVVPQGNLGPIYVMVETYMHNIVPEECNRETAPIVHVELYKSHFTGDYTKVLNIRYQDMATNPIMIPADFYEEGDTYTIEVEYQWLYTPLDVRDYTVSLYSKHELKLVDFDGNTNQIHVDSPDYDTRH